MLGGIRFYGTTILAAVALAVLLPFHLVNVAVNSRSRGGACPRR